MRMITVLIAEDEKLIRAGIRRLVERFFQAVPDFAHQILEARSGRDAYRKCIAGNVDILITDIKMPSMSGVALAKKLRDDGSNIRILAVSGHQDYEYVRAMMKLGAHDYLIKPIDSKQMFEAMSHLVQGVGAPPVPAPDRPQRAPEPAAPFLALSVRGEVPAQGAKGAERTDAFFDLDAPKDASAAQPKKELVRTVNLLLGGADGALLKAAVDRLFGAYQFRRTGLTDVRRDISWLQYELMGKSADFIEFISKNRFGRYDLTDCVGGAPSLSQARSRVLETLQHLLGQMLARRESQSDQMLAQAKAFMQAHFPSDLQLNQVAEIVHLHPNYFSVLFSQRVGMTFREYLRQLRIDAAKNLILTTSLSTAEIAERVGYGDSAHFFRAFKSVTGMTPSTFRRTQGG